MENAEKYTYLNHQGWETWEKYFESVLDAIDAGIAITNKSGICIFVNNAYMDLTQVDKKDYIGKHVNTILEEGFVNCVISTQVIERKTKISIVDKRNGRDLLITGTPLFNQMGELEFVINVARDVSDLMDLEKRLEKSEQLQKKYFARLELINAKNSFNDIKTKNQGMKKIVELAFRVAQTEASMLVLGETGVGKGLLAKCIHNASARVKQPFIKIDCSVIPENLFESELFGYEPGSFTGAGKQSKPGMIELANAGTLFLDEIGELPLAMQSKMLRAIQDKEIFRVGGTKSIKVDFRIISATNQDLHQMISQKKFREDLFYRLNVVPIKIPPLRDRKEDIILLLDYYLEMLNRKYDMKKWLSPQSIGKLINHTWPGNIRELENTIERLVVISANDCIEIGDLFGKNTNEDSVIDINSELTLKQVLDAKEEEIIKGVYSRLKSSRKVAKALGMSQSSIIAKIHKYNINLE